MLCSPPLTLSLAPKPKPTRDETGASYDPAQLQSHSRARSFGVTVHRVQGATLEGDVHVLLFKEFFVADGQAVCRGRSRALA